MVLAHAPCHGDAQQLLEEQDHVPVKFGRALHITAFPGLLHQDRHCPARHEALPLQISLVAHHEDWHLAAAAFPAGAKRTKQSVNKMMDFDSYHLYVCHSGWQGVCKMSVCSFSCFLRCAGADWRITAHRLKGPPTTLCSDWFTAL